MTYADLTLYAILLAIWFYMACLGPITLWRDKLKGANGKNWPGLVIMKKGIPLPGAVWAQEAWESRMRGAFAPVDPFLIVFGRNFPATLGFYERWLEIRGQEIEVQAEVALDPTADESSIRWREAESLVRYYEVFKDWDVNEVHRRMMAVSRYAENFVLTNLAKIAKKNRHAG